MNCTVCYNNDRSIPPMSLEYLDEFFRRLPKKVLVRFLGGEPTVSERLFDAIRIVKKHRHIPSVITNGIKLADYDYAKELAKLRPLQIGVSFAGGLSFTGSKKLYGDTKYMGLKIQALENLEKLKWKRVTLCCTLVKGVNEYIVQDMYDIVEMFKPMIKYIHFRSQIKYGSYIETGDFSIEELEELTGANKPYKIVRDGKKDPLCCGGCKLVKLSPDLELTLIETSNEINSNCRLRGYVRHNFLIEPFWNSLRRNGH